MVYIGRVVTFDTHTHIWEHLDRGRICAMGAGRTGSSRWALVETWVPCIS
jgi:hypothetical protein